MPDDDAVDLSTFPTPPQAIWTDASFWGSGHSWAWIDDLGNFAHGRSRGWAVDSNDAELWAIAEGLRATASGALVHINTDCAIAASLLKPFADVRGLTMKTPPDVRRFRESRDEVGRLCWDRTVVVHQIKGHSADRRNRAADKLATAARRQDSSPAFWSRAWGEAVRGVVMDVAAGSGEGAICTCGPLVSDSN